MISVSADRSQRLRTPSESPSEMDGPDKPGHDVSVFGFEQEEASNPQSASNAQARISWWAIAIGWGQKAP
jgi:hypothetical protein